MSLDLRPLVHPSYWLTAEPPAVYAGSGRAVILVFLAMIAASFVIRRFHVSRAKDRAQAELLRRVASMLGWMGAVGGVLFFFSYEQIRMMGGRFWYLIWLLGLAVWIATIVRYAKHDVPNERKRAEDRRARDKYLPGKGR